MDYREPMIPEALGRRAADLGVTLHLGREELVDELEPLWLSMFDHHLSTGAAGIRRRRLRLGHVHTGPDDTWDTGDRIGEVESLAVLPLERGGGIGTLLLDCAEAILDRRGARDVMIGVLSGNDDAQRFYERRGMTPAIVKLLRVGPKSAREA